MAWLAQIEQSPLGGGLLAFNIGLGKTVVALGYILLAPASNANIDILDALEGPSSTAADATSKSTEVNIAPLRLSAIDLAKRKHKPTLILYPSQAIGV